MSDHDPTPPPAFDSSTLFDDPTPKRVVGPPPEEKGSPILVIVLAVAALVILGGIVYTIIGASSGDEDAPPITTGLVAIDPVERFHERTDRLFEDSVTREQREAIGQSVCEAVETSSDPRTVQDFFRDRFAEGDVKLLFEASANAWCPEHAAALAIG